MQTPAVDGEGLEGLDGGREGKLVAIGRGGGEAPTGLLLESLRTGKLMGPPPHTHTKGWINPNDWERGGGVLRLYRYGIPSPGLILVAQMRKRNQEGPG